MCGIKIFHALDTGSLELAKKIPLYILPMAEAAELLHNDSITASNTQ
jgi:hypothetical protein